MLREPQRGGEGSDVSARGELLAHLARLLAEAAPVVAELAALEGAVAFAPPPPPRSRPRARSARVPCNDVMPILTALDARAAQIVTQKLRTTR